MVQHRRDVTTRLILYVLLHFARRALFAKSPAVNLSEKNKKTMISKRMASSGWRKSIKDVR